MWFATADLHLGHKNILEYCGRPFSSVDEMNEALIDNWNGTVGADDEVYVLGDMCLGRIAETLPLVGLLNGRKTLVPGNHDRCWKGHKKGWEKWEEKYVDAGFLLIDHGPTFLTFDPDCPEVQLHHFPYHGDSHGEDRYADSRPVDHGGWLLHGHVHDAWQVKDRQINVGVDVHNYRPVNANVLADIIRTAEFTKGK